MPPKVTVKCQECGNSFGVIPSRLKHNGGKYCSRSCYGKAQSRIQIGENNASWKGGKRIKVCYQCGKEFATNPADIKKGGGRYCSRKCYYDAHKKIDRICKQCGKPFQEHPSTYYSYGGKYCSRDCYNKSRLGKIKLVCKRCGKEFESYKENTKYCSRNCYHGNSKQEVVCIICGKTFLAYPSAIKNGRKYCSKECYYKGIKLNWENPEYKSKMIEIGIAVQNRPEMIGLHREQGYKRIQTEATKQLLRDKRKGEDNPYYGKHHPPEVLEKMRGENNGSWKGGITDLYDAIRSCNEYDIWRTRSL